MANIPSGYQFLRIVLIAGGAGFGLLAAFYLISGQPVPGLFALLVAVVELSALPLFRKLFDISGSAPAAKHDEKR